MSFQSNSNQFKKFGYFWHSQPSRPDGITFFDKGVLRPALYKARSIINGEAEGDLDAAKKELKLHGSYQDSLGTNITNDNPNMMSGRAAQHYADAVLLHEKLPSEAYGDALNMLHSYQSSHWRDAGADKRVIEHRTTLRYGADGKASKEPVACEFELVLGNALDGVREATAGDNRIVGEVELNGLLPKCILPYKASPTIKRARSNLKHNGMGRQTLTSREPTAYHLLSKSRICFR